MITWPRMLVDPENLVGSSEAAEIAGMSTHAFKQARLRGTTPEPLVRLACGPIWTRSMIENWAAERAARRP